MELGNSAFFVLPLCSAIHPLDYFYSTLKSLYLKLNMEISYSDITYLSFAAIATKAKGKPLDLLDCVTPLNVHVLQAECVTQDIYAGFVGIDVTSI